MISIRSLLRTWQSVNGLGNSEEVRRTSQGILDCKSGYVSRKDNPIYPLSRQSLCNWVKVSMNNRSFSQNSSHESQVFRFCLKLSSVAIPNRPLFPSHPLAPGSGSHVKNEPEMKPVEDKLKHEFTGKDLMAVVICFRRGENRQRNIRIGVALVF